MDVGMGSWNNANPSSSDCGMRGVGNEQPLTQTAGERLIIWVNSPSLKKDKAETSLVVPGLRLHAPSAGCLGLIPGQGTRPHTPNLKTSSATTNDPACCNEDLAQPDT